MSEFLQITGGARVGWVNWSWPFGQLTATPQELTVTTPFRTCYRFTPREVVALEPYGWIPVLWRGVRIIHAVDRFPGSIIFWCFGSPERLIERITGLGFVPLAQQTQVVRRERMPFRWSFVILLLLAWNGLLIADGFVVWKESPTPGPYTMLALALLFLTSVALAFSKTCQAWILKPGRSIDEVRPLAWLVMVISALMLIAFGTWHLAS